MRELSLNEMNVVAGGFSIPAPACPSDSAD